MALFSCMAWLPLAPLFPISVACGDAWRRSARRPATTSRLACCCAPALISVRIGFAGAGSGVTVPCYSGCAACLAASMLASLPVCACRPSSIYYQSAIFFLDGPRCKHLPRKDASLPCAHDVGALPFCWRRHR